MISTAFRPFLSLIDTESVNAAYIKAFTLAFSLETLAHLHPRLCFSKKHYDEVDKLQGTWIGLSKPLQLNAAMMIVKYPAAGIAKTGIVVGYHLICYYSHRVARQPPYRAYHWTATCISHTLNILVKTINCLAVYLFLSRYSKLVATLVTASLAWIAFDHVRCSWTRLHLQRGDNF